MVAPCQPTHDGCMACTLVTYFTSNTDFTAWTLVAPCMRWTLDARCMRCNHGFTAQPPQMAMRAGRSRRQRQGAVLASGDCAGVGRPAAVDIALEEAAWRGRGMWLCTDCSCSSESRDTAMRTLATKQRAGRPPTACTGSSSPSSSYFARATAL